jgi:DUF4097 and DUF4098 domain-containing protein YvlB
MANPRPRSSGLFNGIILIFIGALLLLHNYRGLELGLIFRHWWPLFLIVWGLVKLYERTAGARAQEPGAGRIGSGEIFLIVGLLALIGIVIGVDTAKDKFSDEVGIDFGRPAFPFDLDVAPQPIPADARITIRAGRGDVSVRASDQPEIRVSGKKNIRAWNETEAERTAEHATVEIVKNGDAYEVRPTGLDRGSRASIDMEVVVPKRATVTIHTEKGDINVADMGTPVTVNGLNGDLEVRNTTGDVSLDVRHGTVKVSDTKGNVRISGRGESIEAVNATGGLTVSGNFRGPIRAEKLGKGVHFVSNRTDLTVSQLTGHMEATSGNLEVVDAPGNLEVRSRHEDIRIENAGGKVRVDDRNGNIEVRFSFPPKEDIEITNASANIALSLPESSNFEIVADCHSGDIDSEFDSSSLKKTSTHSGDSHLEGKYGSGRGPRITLKTSYGTISIRRLSGFIPAPPKPPALPGRMPRIPRPEEQ